MWPSSSQIGVPFQADCYAKSVAITRSKDKIQSLLQSSAIWLSSGITPTMRLATERRFWDLLIASFGALFFEMLLVRWLPTTIYYLGYYKNSILFATFLGFGCGAATHRRAHRVLPYFMLFVTAAVLCATAVEHYTSIVSVRSEEFLWPQMKPASVEIPFLAVLLIVFAGAALLMVPLGRLVGTYIEAFPPITAYSINVGASLFGVISFLVLSYLSLGPVVWFTIAALPIFYFVRTSRAGLICNLTGLVMTLAVLQFFRTPQEFWSPYSKISLDTSSEILNARMLLTNNNGHQVLYDLSKERLATASNMPAAERDLIQSHAYIYDSAYSILQPRSVLIVGGGSGNEAAAAIRRNVEKIDVVEIDPVIIEIGRRYHPERPYGDPRVRVINDDARHYMATTSQRYDLVIFGFLDSTSQLSSMSNIRLDNYVYTLESFKQARALLNDGGLLQVTYYAIADFVRARILSMIEEAFDRPPLIAVVSDSRNANMVLFAGPAVGKISRLSIPGLMQVYTGEFSAETRRWLSVTDDWPYLYVRGRSIGGNYLLGLGAMILISLFFIRTLVWSGPTSAVTNRLAAACFFLQGAGFMLLETNTIMRMALILGSTWIVTSVAIILVLLAALVSNLVVQRFAAPSLHTVMVFLTATILLNFAIDIHFYMGLPGPFRTLLAAFQVYCPMLASSLVFGRLFQRSDQTSYDFGMNILGAMVGGMLEYTSLIFGVRAVYLLSLAIFLAIVPLYNRMIPPKRSTLAA
jgi:hypothetical protein